MEAINVKYKESGDVDVFTMECPICHEVLDISTNGWWKTMCECGYNWELKLTAYGEKQ